MTDTDNGRILVKFAGFPQAVADHVTARSVLSYNR